MGPPPPPPPSIISLFLAHSPSPKPNPYNSLSSIIHALDSREFNSRSSNPVLRPDNPKDNPDFMSGLAALQAAFEENIFGPKSPVHPPRIFPATCSLFVMQLAGQRCVFLARMPEPVSRERVPRWSSCPALHRRRFLRHRVLHCTGAGLRHTLRHDAPAHVQRRVSVSTPVFSTCFIASHFLLPQVSSYPLRRVPVLRLRRHPARLPAR